MDEARTEAPSLSAADGVRPQPLAGKTQQVIASAIVSTLAFISGVSVGWPSPVQARLRSHLSDDAVSWLAATAFLGGAAGPLLWGRAAGLGRKPAGYLAASFFLIGSAITASTDGYPLLIAARFLSGLGSSGAMIIGSTYISEVAQDSIRGALGSLLMLNLNAGVVFAYVFGGFLAYESFNLTIAALPLIFFAAFFWMPESPEFLWSRNEVEAAQESLLWLRGGNLKVVEEETSRFVAGRPSRGASLRGLFRTRGRKAALLIGLGLLTSQQLSAIFPILSYTSFIFLHVGSSIPPGWATVIVGSTQLIGSFISTAVIDRCGRKSLLLVSYFFIALSLATLGTYFYFFNSDDSVFGLSWIPIVSLSVHVLSYAIGAGPVPYIVMSETLPIDIKGLAISVITIWGTLMAFVNVKVFPPLMATIGLSWCLWIYAVFSVVSCVFTWRVVPETKGLPLQDILFRLNGYCKDDA